MTGGAAPAWSERGPPVARPCLANTVWAVAETNAVTASSGADTPVMGVEEYQVDETNTHRARNREMHAQYQQLRSDLEAAEAAGDARLVTHLKFKVESLKNDFVAANWGLAMDGARPFLRVASYHDTQDHEASALEGLWKAFVSWDPEQGTFGNFSRRFITGQTRRSVNSMENGQLKYTAWTQKPAVDAARRELLTELGRTPTYEQIAARAKVSVETVRIVCAPAPVSLSTPLGEDGGETLGDRVADLAVDGRSAEREDLAEEAVLAAAKDMHALDLFVLAMRKGITGRPELSVVETADRLGVGRGLVNNGYDRAMVALGAPSRHERKRAKQAAEAAAQEPAKAADTVEVLEPVEALLEV